MTISPACAVKVPVPPHSHSKHPCIAPNKGTFAQVAARALSPKTPRSVEHKTPTKADQVLPVTVDDLVTQLAACSLSPKPKREEEKKAELPLRPKHEEEKKSEVTKYKVITNVHNDDIHNLLRLSPNTFVSGSKDGSLKLWDADGTLRKVAYEPSAPTYTQWITALGTASDGYWLSGTRNGLVDVWDTAGDWQYTLYNTAEAHNPHFCKARNYSRVLALQPYPSCEHVLIGWPTQFTVHDYNTGDQLRYHTVDANDWVYALTPLSLQDLLVVIGSRLELWRRTTAHTSLWAKSSILVREPELVAGQRSFISATTLLRCQPSSVGLSIFGGKISIYDLAHERSSWKAHEHARRVWTIENIGARCIASCSDDGTIKVWDPRIAASIHTIVDNEKEPSRVSSLLELSDHSFLAGSCPDDPHFSKTKARFSFYDLRR